MPAVTGITVRGDVVSDRKRKPSFSSRVFVEVAQNLEQLSASPRRDFEPSELSPETYHCFATLYSDSHHGSM